MSLEGIEVIFSENIIKGKKILNVKATNLVGPGENYGGEVLKLEITTENEITKSKEILHAVAKKIPVLELFQKIFNIQKTFKSEISFYEKLVPIFQDFQRENNIHNVIHCFSEFYGSRLNLNGSDVVDRDALILMENLVTSGYNNIDRYIGYNLEEAKNILKNLAVLHAVPLAIKLKKPEFFEEEVKPFLNNDISTFEESPSSDINTLLEDILWESDKCAPFVPKVKKLLKKNKVPPKHIAREPFATFCHADLWVNNTMMKYEEGKPISSKFVDFQIYNYNSPAIDLLHFLLTSVQTEILKEEFDNLLKFYHSEFLNHLKSLGCDVELFSYLKFQEELAKEAPIMFPLWSFFIIFVVFGPKHAVSFGLEQPDFNNIKIRDDIRKAMHQGAKEKLHFIVELLEKKNWL